MLNFELNPLLEHVLSFASDISDINLSVGRPPQAEVNGLLCSVPTRGLTKLTPFQTEVIALHLIGRNRDLARRLHRTGSVDLSHAIPGKTRFRVNVFRQRGTYSIVLRVIPQWVPKLDDLHLPKELHAVPDLRNGLVLVTGPTGSGKSTTLAAMINEINHRHAYHIVTVEDPIEYLHSHALSTVNQREIGTDAKTFAEGLRAALRQAPKVLLVGEMRDVETVETAMEAAETGHLVLSTLHTTDAAKTIDRIVGFFPREEEESIRRRFAQSFRYVISQRLAKRDDVEGRIAVLEILKATQRTRDYVARGEGEGRSLIDAMNQAESGMQSFDRELERLVRAGILSRDVALSHSSNVNDLSLSLGDTDGDEEVSIGVGAATSTGTSKLPDWME
ncbi:MAG: PilT/PilU family type 4a pilus ATPase [Acidobacteriota bacterium]